MTAASARWRSLVGGGLLLVRRRAGRDASTLLAWMMTVSFTMLVAIAGPAYLARTVDAGAREVIETAGETTDLLLETPVGVGSPSFVEPGAIEAEVITAREDLPREISRSISGSSVAVTGPRLLVGAADVAPALAGVDDRLRLAPLLATSAMETGLSVVDGAGLDGSVASGGPIPVLISTDAAAVSALGVGSVVSLPLSDTGAPREAGTSPPLQVEVVGIVEQLATGPRMVSPWTDAEEFWEPSDFADGDGSIFGIAVLMAPESVARLIRSQGSTFTAVIRYSSDPAGFTSRSLSDAAEQTRRLLANSAVLEGSGGWTFQIASGLPDAAAAYPDSARAALAQLSIVIAGVIGAAAAVLVLASGLVVGRRVRDTVLERARGSSMGAIVLRTGAESIILAALAFGIALGIAGILGLLPVVDVVPLIVVTGVAVIAGTVQLAVSVRAASSPSPVSVDRREVVRRATAKRIARLSVEAAVLLLAVGAAVALLSRGLAEQSAGFGVDPLAAAGPLAIAAVATVIMVRACVILLPLAAAAALRVRGVAGPIVASRLGRRIEVVPLAAVTIAVALVVGTGVLSSTVRAGQVDAAWLAVGADVRVDGGVDSDTVDSVAQEDGVTAASGYSARSGQLEVASNTARVTVIAVDAGYPALLEALPDIEGLPDADVATAFRGLVGTTVGPLPAIVDSGSAARLVEDETVVTIGDDDVRVRIIGTVPTQPGVEGSSVYVDVDALADRVSVSVGVDSLVAIGLGAGAAVASIDSDGGTVLTREGWVDDRRRSALISGVDRGMSAGTVILAVLALLAVVSFALAGSANRARTIALLRTLGVRPRFGVLLSLVDQLPLLAASLVGGILAGVGAAALFLPALGLEFLTGGRSAPPLSIPPEVIGLACGGILVVFVLGTLIEVVLRRRDRVSDTIRVGGAS